MWCPPTAEYLSVADGEGGVPAPLRAETQETAVEKLPCKDTLARGSVGDIPFAGAPLAVLGAALFRPCGCAAPWIMGLR